MLCQEHDVQPNGLPSDNKEGSETDSVHTFYNKTHSGIYVPRALFVDLEPTVVGMYENEKI